jgi:curved DNA-binding protein CbpA
LLTDYDLLGVEPTADLETIRRAWRVKVQLLHPDRHQGAPAAVQAEAARESLRINRAWERLRDPQRRKQYDLRLARRVPGAGTGAGTVTCSVCKTSFRMSRPAPAVGRWRCPQCTPLHRFVPRSSHAFAHVFFMFVAILCVVVGGILLATLTT